MNTPKCHCISDRDFSPESFHHSAQPSLQPKVWLSHLRQYLVHILSTSYEPKVWQKVDRQGRTVGWRVFDPESGQTIPFGSELEVRLWLEQRYYR